MKDFGDILNECNDLKTNPVQVRKKYLKEISQITGRNVITYYSSFLRPGVGTNLALSDDDMVGFMSAVTDMDTSKGLDLILHLPGGSGEAAEGIVKFLHNKFGNDIRVIIPQMAMSAGTMIACSAKTILMTSHSFLGPTDPQFDGQPAYNIVQAYGEAMYDLKKNPDRIAYWQIQLAGYPHSFYCYVNDVINISKVQLNEWLSEYMFADETDKNKREATIKNITKTLIRGRQLHGKHFDIDDCRKMGLKVESLESEENKKLNEAITCLHYAYVVSLEATNEEKIIENQFGKTYSLVSRRPNGDAANPQSEEENNAESAVKK